VREENRNGLPRPLLRFRLAGMLVLMGEQAKSQFLPPADVGPLAGAQAALELLMVPPAGRLADRIGLAPVLAITFLPVPYLLGVGTATSLPLLAGLQPLEAAAVAGFGIGLYSAGWAAATLATGLPTAGAAQLVGSGAGLRLGALTGWGLLLATRRLAGHRQAT
jgi:MFS family permease